MKSRAFLVLLVPVLAVPFFRAGAQDQTAPAAMQHDRLSVRAKGRVVAPADELELTIVVQGIAEEAKDAEKKHRDRLRRLMAALTGKEESAKAGDESTDGDDSDDGDKPKKKAKKKKGSDEEPLPAPGVPDDDGLVLEVREGRYTLGVKGDPSAMPDDGGDDGTPKKETELACGSCVHVTFKNLQKSTPRKVRRLLARILDRASDAGADLGPPKTRLKPTLRFRSTTIDGLKKEAYARAIAKAKARAGDLATLAGRALGKVSVVTDVTEGTVATATLDDARTSDYEAYLALLQAVDPTSSEAFSGSSEIAVEAAVELEFELK